MISGIVAAVIIGLAISIHLRLSALEPEGQRTGVIASEITYKKTIYQLVTV
jgi:hypothetical protein